MISSGIIKKYSIERILMELEEVQVIEDQKGNLRELERTKNQKDIIDTLDKASKG